MKYNLVQVLVYLVVPVSVVHFKAFGNKLTFSSVLSVSCSVDGHGCMMQKIR